MTFWVAGAIVGAGVLGATGSVIAGNKQASADEQAANTQYQMFNTIKGQEQPFLEGGYGAETSLQQLLGLTKGGGSSNGYLTQQFNPSDLQNYPGYQFQLQQGDQAIQNSAAATTGAVSGPALKSLMNYNQGLAGTTYGQAFNQFQTQQNNIFSRLNQIAGLGQNAAGNLGNAGTSLGTGIAQAQAAGGAAQAGGIVGATNALGGSGVPLSYLLSGQGGGSGSGINSGAPGSNDPDPYGTGGSYCDIRLKSQIVPHLFNGESNLMVYDFEFNDEPGVQQRGYLAQEVIRQYPEAVHAGPKGFLKVDYSKLPGWDELDSILKAH